MSSKTGSDGSKSERKYDIKDLLITSSISTIVSSIVTSILNIFFNLIIETLRLFIVVFILSIIIYLVFKYYKIERSSRNTAIAVILIVIGVVIYYFVTMPQIKITNPNNSEYIDRYITINGTAKNIPTGYKIWIVTTSIESGNSYLLNKVTTSLNDPCNWSLSGPPVGHINDYNKQFKITAYLADKEASTEFDKMRLEYIQFEKNNISYNGIDIPNGAIKHDEVAVTRKNESFSQL